MLKLPPSTPLRGVCLAALAVVAALISNALASPARRLAWSGSKVHMLPPAAWDGPLAPPPPVPPPLAPATPLPPLPVQTQADSLTPALPFHPTPATPNPPLKPLPPQPPETPNTAPIREITSEEAWKAHQAGASFLDARRSAEFAEGHVAGAWSAPVWESDLEDRLFAFKAARRPGPEDPIVIYCSGGDCKDSHLLANKLITEGYFHLLIYRDGFPAWSAQGHPTQKGQP